MKGLLLLLAMLAGSIFDTNSVKAQGNIGAKIELKTDLHDYGNLKEGEYGTCTLNLLIQEML